MALYWIKNSDSLRLAIAARPRGGDWLGDDLRRLKNAGVDVLVSMLTQNEMKELGLLLEQKECRACGIEYLNFPIKFAVLGKKEKPSIYTEGFGERSPEIKLF